MRRDIVTFKPINSTFFSCSKDIKKILQTLFVVNRPYSDYLKRLLIINNKDCLDFTNQDYQKVIDNFSLADMMDNQYIKINPKITRGNHEQVKSYIIISFDDFSPDDNNVQYRNYIINFDIICYTDTWNLTNYKIRPLAICGYIDGILNSLTNKAKNSEKSNKPNIKLSGVGEYQFLGCNYHILNEEMGMYTLSYLGKMFSQDVQQYK